MAEKRLLDVDSETESQPSMRQHNSERGIEKGRQTASSPNDERSWELTIWSSGRQKRSMGEEEIWCWSNPEMLLAVVITYENTAGMQHLWSDE